jgi:hypothetical protein
MQEKDDGGRTQREKSIDEWLPINSSRKAKWWYSAFHNVTAMVGAGVLGLPYAMSELGWYVVLYYPFIYVANPNPSSVYISVSITGRLIKRLV